MTHRSKLILGVCAAIGFLTYLNSSKAVPARASQVPKEHRQTAVFAGGCFWCMEAPFENVAGVIEAESGYTGGHVKNPTYRQVCAGNTGHLEAIKVTYDARALTYDDLLNVFWRSIDPTDAGGQFVDRGESYASAIFVANDQQRTAAKASLKELDESKRFKKPVVTPIRDAETFYLAEEYHQDYYKKSKLKYKLYRFQSGRDQFIDRVWGADRNYTPPSRDVGLVVNSDGTRTRTYGRPSESAIRNNLTDLQFQVTQQDATERPFNNEFWDNKKAGIYVDIVSGEPLFSSRDKFKSGTGWPSFSRPIGVDSIVQHTDYKLVLPRTEVRSKYGDSHLGHVFSDGPQPTGLRYCINSASLKFIPVSQLEEMGYGEFAKAFASPKK